MEKGKGVELTQEMLKEILDYNPDTGHLTWKTRRLSLFATEKHGKTWNTRFAGKRADNLNTMKSGYQRYRITIFRKNYSSHRVVWLWMTGSWPKDGIDHIDRDATNNKWDNLREATLLQNGRNISKMSRNTSGVTGVCWRKDRGHWKAQVRINGKEHHLGSFHKDDLHLAAEVVQKFRLENGFDPEHGMEHAHYYKGASK